MRILPLANLSDTTKMPGFSWSISALKCKTGGRLRKIPGSVCEDCYAMKGHYRRPNVTDAHQRRYDALRTPRQWTEQMVERLSAMRNLWFRWFDSGDLQSMRHLKAIVEIAERVPKMRFWLPTKEAKLLHTYLKGGGKFPKNLTVRLSHPMKFKAFRQAFRDAFPEIKTSSVDGFEGYRCPAYSQGGKCGECRACWDPTVENIDYPLH